MTPGQRLRRLANLLNGSTLLGLLLARLAGTTTVSGPRGLAIATGYTWKLPLAGAFTVGNVVIFRAGPEAALRNPALLGHEERHSTQYACLGLPFLVLYFAAAGWSLLRHGDPASGNPFERHAGLEAGGYPGSAAEAARSRRTAGRRFGKFPRRRSGRHPGRGRTTRNTDGGP